VLEFHGIGADSQQNLVDLGAHGERAELVGGAQAAYPYDMRLILLFGSWGVAACAPAVQTVRLTSHDPHPVDYPISMFTAGSALNCAYEQVGLVEARQRNSFIPMEQVTESVRIEARQLGGDAVINVQMDQRAMSVSQETGVDYDPVISGTVIRWRDSNCTN
jgi:hypothetical protein